jgi:nitrous oxidase accessory protein
MTRIVALAAGALCALLLASVPGAQAAEHTVRPGESVAAAVAAARAGDVVRVLAGTYTGNVVVDKPLTLRGVGRPTLSAARRGDVVRVAAPDVTIEGFVVRDSGADLSAQNAGIYVTPRSDRVVVRDNVLADNLFGLWIEKVSAPVVAGNVVTGRRDLASAQRGNGIQLYDTRGAQVLDNDIGYTRDGIYVDVSHHALFRGNRMHDLRYGTHYMNSNDNVWEGNATYRNRGGLALMEVRRQVVRGNVAWGNEDHGIMLRTIQDSVIEDNVVVGNGKGFFVYDAEYNVIRGNLVARNAVGMHVWAGSIHNDVDGNDFIDNEDQVRYVAARDQEWGRREGNYWSNYAGFDADGNGVGDVPYAASDVVDHLAWRQPLVKLLLTSPAVQSLRAVARQFPLLRAPSIVDRHPRMRPRHPDWSAWLEHEPD